MSRTLLVLMTAILLVSTALATEDSTAIVAEDTIAVPTAPFYESIDEARAAVGDDRNILVDFYTDW